MTQPKRPPLVFIERPVQCAICSRWIVANTEARRWIGNSLAHPQCAESFAGPGGT